MAKTIKQAQDFIKAVSYSRMEAKGSSFRVRMMLMIDKGMRRLIQVRVLLRMFWAVQHQAGETPMAVS